MRITNVKVAPHIDDGSKLKGIAVVTLEDVFVVRDIRVIDGNQGLFIAMPSFKMASGIFRDVCHPICSSFQDELKKAIINEYERLTK